MTFEAALRATEVLLALAFLQQCAEHIFGTRDSRFIFLIRAVLSVILLLGSHSNLTLLALSLHSLLVLHHYDGPYNGGSDRMGLLILYCLCLSRWLPEGIAQQLAFAYLGFQVLMSYFIAGQVKIANPEWRSGRALQDVFRFSAYPVSEGLRRLADRPRLLFCASWVVMLFEVLFPLSLLTYPSLILGLCLAAAFHLANSALFGLNRFVWAWVASYPSVIWLQGRLITASV